MRAVYKVNLIIVGMCLAATLNGIGVVSPMRTAFGALGVLVLGVIGWRGLK